MSHMSDIEAELQSDVKLVQKQNIAKVLLYAFIGVITLAVGATLLLIVLQTSKLESLAQETKLTADRLADCTVPTGKCYQDGNRRTGAAVKTLNELSILASYCAHVPENSTVAKVKACIEAEYNKEGNGQ